MVNRCGRDGSRRRGIVGDVVRLGGRLRLGDYGRRRLLRQRCRCRRRRRQIGDGTGVRGCRRMGVGRIQRLE